MAPCGDHISEHGGCKKKNWHKTRFLNTEQQNVTRKQTHNESEVFPAMLASGAPCSLAEALVATEHAQCISHAVITQQPLSRPQSHQLIQDSRLAHAATYCTFYCIVCSDLTKP